MDLAKTVIFLVFFIFDIESRKLSAKKSLIYGPALSADVTVPVRYLYIQAVDTEGKNFTESPGSNVFSFSLGDRRIRAWQELLDRNDGTFLLRFRLYESYKNLRLEFTLDGEHVAQSPYMVKGMYYHEQCVCPEPDLVKWREAYHCPTENKQIDEDFVAFPQVNLTLLRTEGIKRFGRYHAVCHYSIINNEIYRKCHGEHVGFAQFADDWFLSLARKVHLPDIEFIFNLGDWPLSRKISSPIPVISWGGSDDTYDIVIPTYDLTESVLETMGRVSLDMMSVQANTGPRWQDKVDKGFFRGRDSRQERLDLTVLGRSKPDLFDVAITTFFFFDYDEKLYGPKVKHISFFDFFKYKYQLNVDGTVAAYRFPYLLVGDSVVFKQNSPYYEHFYMELEPWKHYIPFHRDVSNLEELIIWAKNNDGEVRKIGLAGQQYARDNLMSDRLYCYTMRVFQEYSKRQTEKVKRHKDMEHIKQPGGPDSECSCLRGQGSDTRADAKTEL